MDDEWVQVLSFKVNDVNLRGETIILSSDGSRIAVAMQSHHFDIIGMIVDDVSSPLPGPDRVQVYSSAASQWCR